MEGIEAQMKKGTTTVGLMFKEGVVLAADRRAAMGYLVASKSAKKILEVTDRIAMTTAGGVGDNQMLNRYLKSEMKMYEIRKQKKPNVKATATILSHILFSKRMSFTPFLVQIILAGVDENGPHLYSLDLSGGISEDLYTATGSGSVVAYGLLENSYKKGMEMESAVKLAVNAVNVAIQRDIGTGDGIDVMVITKDGIKRLPEERIKEILKK